MCVSSNYKDGGSGKTIRENVTLYSGIETAYRLYQWLVEDKICKVTDTQKHIIRSAMVVLELNAAPKLKNTEIQELGYRLVHNDVAIEPYANIVSLARDISLFVYLGNMF